MKFKRFIYFGLVLSGGLFGCAQDNRISEADRIANNREILQQATLIDSNTPPLPPSAQSFLGRLRPPSADQVKKWAGFPESTHLTTFTNIPDHVWYGNPLSPGKFKWVWAYEERKGSNFTCIVIAVYEPGALWSTNRARIMDIVDQVYKNSQKIKTKEGEKLAREMAPITMPNGQKSYFFLIGLFPARFAFHPEFDVFAYYDAEPISYDESHPPADLTAMPTNSFSDFFTNVDAFLTSQ